MPKVKNKLHAKRDAFSCIASQMQTGYCSDDQGYGIRKSLTWGVSVHLANLKEYRQQEDPF